MGRKNSRADRQTRVRNDAWGRNRQNALSACLSASLAASEAGEVLGGLGTEYRAPRSPQALPTQAINERAVIGLVRAAVNEGASVAEVAAATGRSKAWVRSHLSGRG